MLDAMKAGEHLFLGMGTHDAELIARVADYAQSIGLGKDSFDVEMLYGIRTDQQKKLAGEGYTVRVLIAYGEAWYPWYMRRLSGAAGERGVRAAAAAAVMDMGRDAGAVPDKLSQALDQLSGVWNIVPTPFHPDEELDLDLLRTLTDFVIGSGVDGMTILGVLGEGQASDRERSADRRHLGAGGGSAACVRYGQRPVHASSRGICA